MVITRTCPECGVEFTVTHGRQAFCTPAHKRRYHHLMAHRGQMLVPFALTHRGYRPGETERARLRDAPPGERATLAAWSRTQYCALLDRWNAEDKAAGRNPALLVEVKRASKWRAVDCDT